MELVLYMETDVIIGTDATIAEHIKKVLEREYAFKDNSGNFVPSTLGLALVEGYDRISFEHSLAKPYLRKAVCSSCVYLNVDGRKYESYLRW